jgi:uncharacterized membrane protein YeaQ/YmgE (transglycosylase-associated protein family)
MKTLPFADCCSRVGLIRLAVMVVWLLGLGLPALAAPSEAGLTDTAREVADTTSREVEAAGQAAADAVKNIWHRIDEARLVNRTGDELVAWVIVGVLVGAVAGMMTPLKPTGAGKVGRLLLGLVGSFIGGVVVHVGQFDFGWGPVLIRYEELFFALVGAVVVVVTGRLFGGKATKKGEG